MRFVPYISFIILLSACNVLPAVSPPTPTRNFSAPTIAPSPTVIIQNSDDLYGDTQIGGANNPQAASLPNSGALPPLTSGTRTADGADTVQLVLDNGEIVNGDLYAQETRVPGILLLGANRRAWGLLPSEIFARGASVLVVEARQARPADLENLLTSFSEYPAVDPARIAVIGERSFADAALLGCAAYPICDALVLLSPQNPDTLLDVMPNYNPRPMLVVATADNVAAEGLAAVFADGSQRLQVASGDGTAMLATNANLSPQIADWLVMTLTQ